MSESRAISVRPPTFVFNDFDREIFISHSEDLKITEYGFLRLRMTVDLHAEEVSLVLPVQLTLKKAGVSFYERRGADCLHLIH